MPFLLPRSGAPAGGPRPGGAVGGFAAVALLAVIGAGACEDSKGLPPGKPPPVEPLDCRSITPGLAPIRRLTRVEYGNTVHDLFGRDLFEAGSEPWRAFPPEEEALGFTNQADALVVTELLAEQYLDTAEAVSEAAAADLPSLVPCDPEVDDAVACARTFVRDFGRRAFRRPLTDAEIDGFVALHARGAELEGGFTTGVELVVQAMLQSPHFLYRVEFGGKKAPGGVVHLDDHEIATRLSYLIWNSMPDETLFAAADAGELDTPAALAAQARRMLDDPRARGAVANFHTQWLALGALDAVTKNEEVYPAFEPSLPPLWREETLRFLEDVVFEGDGGLGTMLTAPYSVLNPELAAFYGVDAPPGDGWSRVDLDPQERSGFLTQAAILGYQAKPNQSSPVHRGKFVRERLLCQILPPPPNDVQIVPPAVKPGQTTRDRFKQHSVDEGCSSCHVLMDPIGFGFEHYDGIGLWRDEDQGRPVDASGELISTADADGTFDGAVELAARLAESDEVRECVVRQWFRFGYGRPEQEQDACSLAELKTSFAASGYDVKELLVALTQTEAFRYRPAVDAGGSE